MVHQVTQQGEMSFFSSEQLSQPLLAHEETILAESIDDDVEGEVVREFRSIISDVRPVGWLDKERRMMFNTNEADWSRNGISEEEMANIKRDHISKVPTNADCIKYLYGQTR